MTTSVAAARAVDDMTWGKAALDVGAFAVFAVAASLVAARMRLRTRVDLANGR